MVAVSFKRSRSGSVYEVVGGDISAFTDITGGYWWIYACEFDRVKRQLKERYDVTLTKKWYHIKRLKEYKKQLNS